MAPYPAGDLECTDERSRERTRNADDRRTHLVHRLPEATLQMTVHHAASADALLDLAEIVHRNGDVFGVAGEPEILIDVVPYPESKLIDDLARAALRLRRHRTLKDLDELLDLVTAVFAQDIQGHLHGKIALMDVEPPLLEEAREMHRGRIGAVRLQQRRRKQKKTVRGHRGLLTPQGRRSARTSGSRRLSRARPPPSPSHP